MRGSKWGLAGPPPEAYSRITNPERFESLHHVALTHLQHLQDQFDVERVDGYVLDQELKQAHLARPSVKLIPADSNAATIVVAFTSFPAVIMRCGLFLMMAFPACGCDACDETAEGEIERLTDVLDDVVEGRFRESIRIPLFGEAKHEWELKSSTHRMGGGVRLARSHARALVSAGRRTFEWAAWPLR